MARWIAAPGPVADGQRIGLLGGSFDPAHDGHLYVSLVALKALELDHVWWLVSPGNPLKAAPGAMTVRLAGARAMARHPRIRVSDIESRLGTRYTFDTVLALQRRFPRVQFVWLMGTDNLAQFSRWYRWRDIAARVPIAAVRRHGSVLAPLSAALTHRYGLSHRLGKAPSIAILDGRRNFASSTALRGEGLGVAMDTMLNPML